MRKKHGKPSVRVKKNLSQGNPHHHTDTSTCKIIFLAGVDCNVRKLSRESKKHDLE
jgi:hypothetical protein